MMYEMLEGVTPFDKHEICSSEYEYMQNVKNQDVEFSNDDAPVLQDLIKLLLAKDYKQRLGNSDKDSDEILHHKFFEGIKTADYLSLTVKAPYIPDLGKKWINNKLL